LFRIGGDAVNIIIEPRQLKIFAALCVLGVLVAIGDGLRSEPSAPKQSMQECVRTMYALAERGGMVAVNGYNRTMTDIKERVCPLMGAR
jgi:hypothetical protein